MLVELAGRWDALPRRDTAATQRLSVQQGQSRAIIAGPGEVAAGGGRRGGGRGRSARPAGWQGPGGHLLMS